MESTQTTLKHRETKKHRELNKKANRLILGAIFLVGFIAPFSHILYNGTDIVGPFGFKKMSSFLFAIGFPIFLISISYLLHFASTKMEPQLQKIFNVFSILTCLVSSFFLTWAFFPSLRTFGNDFPAEIYYLFMIGISAVLSITWNILFKYLNSTIIGLKRMVNHLVGFIVNEVPDKHIESNRQKEYKKDMWNALGKGAGIE